jgi:DNA-binding Lrp family transcriptional regulator
MVSGLLPPAARKERTDAKRKAILRLLRDEIYTTREVIQELLGVAPTPAKMTLSAMARDGLLRHEQVECPNGWRPHLWGITADGQAMAFDPSTEHPSDRIFEPGRVGLTVVRHTISIQLCRIKAERVGWSEWQAGDRLGMWEKEQGRPDAIALSPTGERMAIEVEHTLKTTKRYESVLWDRLRQIKAGNFEKVCWLTDDLDRARRLESIVKSISEFTREHAGKKQQIRIDPATHHPRLMFKSLGDWPNV